MNVWMMLVSILVANSLTAAHIGADQSPEPTEKVWGEKEHDARPVSIACDFTGFGCSNPVPVVTSPTDDT